MTSLTDLNDCLFVSSAEQKFRWSNRFSKTVNLMDGGSFRFFLLRSSWLRNCTQVWKDEEEKSALNPRYHPDARARQKVHKAACSRSTHQPNLPSQYLDGSRSHFDVRRFRTLWEQDGGFASTDLIKRSASLREKLPSGEKFQLRRGLCDKLLELDVVK